MAHQLSISDEGVKSRKIVVILITYGATDTLTLCKTKQKTDMPMTPVDR